MTFIDMTVNEDFSHPVDAIEAIAGINDWDYERTDNDEIVVTTKGNWSEYGITFNWLGEIGSLHLACAFDIRIPDTRMSEAARLLMRINEQLWVGHFDIWQNDGVVMFRHSHIMNDGNEIGQQVAQTLISKAIDSCDQYYQAFQFVVWGGYSADKALGASMFHTEGNA